MKDTIKKLIEKSNLNEYALAIRLGISIATMKQYMRGMEVEQEVATKIKRLCTLYSVEVNDETI